MTNCGTQKKDKDYLQELLKCSGNLVAETLDDSKQLLEIFEVKNGLSPDEEWVFRGMRDPEYPLEPALERICGFFGINTGEKKKFEKQLLREFVRKCKPYLSVQPCGDDVLQWLAIMQHHGAPTRLLDWTYSVFVAAFFAVNEVSNNGGIIWAIDKKWLNWEARVQLEVENEYVANSVWDSDPWPKDKETFLKKVWKGTKDCVLSATPLMENERLSIQQGTFLIPCNVEKSFQENLLKMNPTPRVLRKTVIPYALRTKILKLLMRMNISDVSLFPGIDGFARSTKYRLLGPPPSDLSIESRPNE